MTRAAAPLLPMTAETIWRGLTGGASVHLEDWPSVADWPSDPSLAETMDLTRAVCSAALSLRKARQLRVRLPLASLTVAHPSAPALTEFADLIKDEVNVKDLALSAEPASLGAVQLTVNPRALGPRLGRQVQEVIRAVKAGDWAASGSDGDVVTAGGVPLQPGEYQLTLTAADPDSTAALPGSDGLIALDTRVTPDARRRGHRPRRHPGHPAGPPRRRPRRLRPDRAGRRRRRTRWRPPCGRTRTSSAQKRWPPP